MTESESKKEISYHGACLSLSVGGLSFISLVILAWERNLLMWRYVEIRCVALVWLQAVGLGQSPKDPAETM